MGSVDTSQFKQGMVIVYNGNPYMIISVQFVNPGKGSAFYRTRIKGVKNEKVIDVTFKSGETIETSEVSVKNMQYLYEAGGEHAFMDNNTYDQIEIAGDNLGKKVSFLKEGEDFKILFLDGEAFGIDLPPKMVFEVTETPPGVKGDSASGATKPATLSNGLVVNVPLFIKEGDKIRINTDELNYVERAN